MTDHPLSRVSRVRSSSRSIFTLAIAAVFALAAVLLRIPTSLGVKVPRASTDTTGNETTTTISSTAESDLSGHEYIWRVWWRARDDLIDVEPQWLMTGGLIALLAIFAGGMLLAIWLVTKPLSDDDFALPDG